MAGPLRLPCAVRPPVPSPGPLRDSPGAHLWCDSHTEFAAGSRSVRMDTSKTLPAFPLPEDLGWPCVTGGAACELSGSRETKSGMSQGRRRPGTGRVGRVPRGVCASGCICGCGVSVLASLCTWVFGPPPSTGRAPAPGPDTVGDEPRVPIRACRGRVPLCLCASLCVGRWTGTGHGAWLRAGAPIFLCWSVPSLDSVLGRPFSERGPLELVQSQAPSAPPQ